MPIITVSGQSVRYRWSPVTVLLPFLGVLVLMLHTATAGADCASACEGDRWACSESADSSTCGTQFQICVQNCVGGESRAGSFGAIAFSSSTEIFGYSYDLDSRGAAEALAVSECHKAGGADDCEAVVWFNQSCGAMASDGDGTYGSDWAATKQEAESKAISNCQEHTDKSCSIRKSLCTR